MFIYFIIQISYRIFEYNSVIYLLISSFAIVINFFANPYKHTALISDYEP